MSQYDIDTLNGQIQYRKEIEKSMTSLRDATDNCPVCIFAALRQSGANPVFVDFDFKQECKEMWNTINEDEREKDERSCCYE